jgi:hypothetical protein
MTFLPADILSKIPFIGIAVVFISLVYWVPAFFLFYHLTRFGIGTRPKQIAFVFMIGSVVIFSVFMIALSQVDFSSTFQLLSQSINLAI